MSNTPELTLPAVKNKSREPLVDWLQRHQVTLFFVLTFLFSWLIYTVLSLTSIENETTYQRILGIAGFGPSLSAILIARISNPAESKPGVSRKLPISWKIILSLVTILLVASVEWWNNIWWGHPYDVSLLLADAVLVALAVFVILWLFSNHGESGWWLLGAKRGKTIYTWMVVALVVWPALFVAGNGIAGVLKVPLSTDPTWPDVPLALILTQSFFWALLFGGPFGEEPGWRGFVLPRLQRRFSPLVASIILGAFWGLWHVPLHIMNAYGGGAFGAVIRIQEIPRAILFTWLYNRSKGSLLVVLLFHASINTTGWFLPRSYVIVLVLCTLLAAILVIKDRMWERFSEPS